MGGPPEGTTKAKSESPTGAVTEALGQLEIRQDVAIQLADGVVRPGYGREGKSVRCFVNLFAVQLKALQITHYDVDIQPMIRDGDEEPRRAPVTDKPLPNDINLQVFNVLKQQITDMTPAQRDVLAYDGRKFAYSPMRLNFREHTQLIDLAAEESTEGANRRQRLFNVTVKEVAQFNLDDVLRFCNANRRDVQAMGAALYESVTRALQSIEICLREDRLVRYKIHGAAGRKMFDPQAAEPISEGAQIWHGFFQSARAVMAGPVINLDPAYSCFLGGGPFLVVGAEVLGLGAGGGGGGRGGRGGRGGFDRGGRGGRGGYQDRGPPAGGARPRLTALNPREEMALRRKLLNVQVRPTHRNGGRPEAFKGFTSQSARQETFQTRDGRTVTVEAYFAETYNIRLQLPHLKCAMIGRRKNFVPLELLDIVGGTPLGPTRMSPNMTADMIRVSARRPNERLERTQQWRQQLAYGQGDRLGKWGLSVDAKPLPVNARVLAAPQVEYKKGGMRPKNGSWNLQGSQFIASGIPLVNLVVINFTRDGPGRVKGFVESLLRSMGNLGVDVRQCVPHYDDLSPDIFELKEAMVTVGKAAFAACKARLGSNAAPPQLYLCILPDGNDVYKRIKSICATQMPSATPSQCVIGSFKKAFGDRGIDMYCANVAMKINIKLGGCNHRVAPQSLPKVGDDCMMIGVDVGHAPPGSSHPSVVAVVANSDGAFRNFWTEVKAQANPRLGNTAVRSQETIVQGRELHKGVLGAWRKQNGGALPTNIIFFRDGVSEGEYSKVVNGEIAQFLAACNEVKIGYHPKVTFIVCTKRHNIRFFAADERDTDGRTGNLPSGTVVDTVCVHPYAHDFYLQSQAGLVGTARPGHYIVLRDEIRFTADEMQKLVFAVCHGFARSTKAVSMPPMTLYAHHAADKARMMLYPEGEFSDTASQVSAGGSRGDVGGHGIDYAQLMQQLDRDSNHPKLTRFSATLWYM